MANEQKDDAPYRPAYKGFDEEATKRAQETAERSQKVQAGKGHYADETYVEEGSEEAGRRRGESASEVEDSVTRANEQGKKKTGR